MPIHLPEPPSEASDAVLQRLNTVGQSETTRRRSLGGSDANDLEPRDAHQVFALGLEDLLNTKDPLAAAVSVGWRFLLADHDEVIAAAQTVAGPEGGHKFASFNSGPHVRGTVSALASARQRPKAAGQDLEVRLFTVPALHLTAIWLHGSTEDILVPMDPAPAGFEGGHPYPANEVLSALAGPARSLVAIGPEDETGS